MRSGEEFGPAAMKVTRRILRYTAIVSILPVMGVSIHVRNTETGRKISLLELRMAIDEYTFDKQQVPRTPRDLMSDGYLRRVPPGFTEDSETWRVILKDVRVGTPYVQLVEDRI